jgi:hypothetical protein
MTKKNINTVGNLESRITGLEKRLSVLEQLSKKFTRKKRDYTEEQKAAIRARLLAGQEAARKRKENEVKVVANEKPAEPKKISKNKPVSTTKKS